MGSEDYAVLGDELMDAHQAWQSVLGQLQMEMPRASFDTWVRGTDALSLEDDLLTVSTRNAYVCDWMDSRLKSTVQRLLVGILNRSVNVQFIVGEFSEEGLDASEEEEEPDVAIEPVQWLDYDRIVEPHKQVVVKGYLRRLGMEIGPKAIWLYIGFHQAAWRIGQAGSPFFSGEVRRFTGLSNGAFWRLIKQPQILHSLKGLVQRADAPGTRHFRRGRDGRPHRMPVRYQVFMTPRLTRVDADTIDRELALLMEQGASVDYALGVLLDVDPVSDLLVAPAQGKDLPFPLDNVMAVAHKRAGDAYTAETDQLAQQLHRKIINSLGDIHIPHYFITRTIHRFNLTPAQAWLVTVARDMAYINSRTGERRDAVTFKRGYQEMAELVDSSRYKTVQGWLNPKWVRRHECGDLSHFLTEVEMPDSKGYADLRVESMPRTFRVLLDEPLDANGSNRTDANGTISVDADGSISRTRMGVSMDADGGNMVGANGSVLNTLKHPLNTDTKNTSSTQHNQTAALVPSFWELKSLLQQNNVHPKVQRKLLDAKASVHAFIAWVLFVASPQGARLSDPLGYALSQLRQDPLAMPHGSFRQFASLPPAELLVLIDSTPTQRYEFIRPIQHPLVQVWKKAMGSHNPRLSLARDILFGEGDSE